MAFDLLLHLGTLVAVCIAFHKQIIEVLLGMYRREKNALLIGGFIIISTGITGVLGLILEKRIEAAFDSPTIVCLFMLVTALMLWASQKWSNGNKTITTLGWKNAALLGLAQAVAMLPGISRSGTTISAGLLVGMNRQSSGEYSFLLSIPIVAAAILVKLPEIANTPQNLSMSAMAWGVFVSFVVGLISLYWLMNFIRKGKLHYFSIYLVLMSLSHLAYFLFFK